MAAKESFDITTGVDLQEIDNAVNQTVKELSTRFDFKGVKFTIDLDRKEGELRLAASDEGKLNAVWDVLQTRLVRRGVPLRNVQKGKVEVAAGSSVRMTAKLVQGLEIEIAREIVKAIKEAGLKKVQSAIQEDQVRVSGPVRDDLQAVIRLLKEKDFGVELKFGNYRSS
jgi:cyclic-di-GMP-binding protein